MINRLYRCLLGLALSTGLLFHQPATAEMPAPPAEVVKATVTDLEEARLSSRVINNARNLYRPVFLTGGSTPDWLVDMNATHSGMLCGTGGCPIEVWVQQDGHYRRALSLQVLGYVIEPKGYVSLKLHGVLCGRTGSDECHYRFGWQSAEGSEGWFLPMMPPDAPGYAGPIVQALAPAAHMIREIGAQEAAYHAWCEKRAGGTPDTTEAAALLPDLTGDARPEALFDANHALCTVTDPEGGEQQAPCFDPAICHSAIYTSTSMGWRSEPAQKPFDYWIKWESGRPRMAIADADCGMCEVREIDLAP